MILFLEGDRDDILPVLDWEFHRRLGSKRLKNDIQAPKTQENAAGAESAVGAAGAAARGPLGSSSHCNLPFAARGHHGTT